MGISISLEGSSFLPCREWNSHFSSLLVYSVSFFSARSLMNLAIVQGPRNKRKCIKQSWCNKSWARRSPLNKTVDFTVFSAKLYSCNAENKARCNCQEWSHSRLMTVKWQGEACSMHFHNFPINLKGHLGMHSDKAVGGGGIMWGFLYSFTDDFYLKPPPSIPFLKITRANILLPLWVSPILNKVVLSPANVLGLLFSFIFSLFFFPR